MLKVDGRKTFVDERLKQLMQELGNAINESLSDSERIAAAIGEIRKAGYDVFLILEATIGFNRREEGAETEANEESDGILEVSGERTFLNQRGETGIRLKFTTQDQKFLRALKISVEEDAAE